MGPVLAARLQSRSWPDHIEVDDFSFGAIDAVHRLRAGGYERVLFFGAHQRGDAPGTIRRYQFQPVDDPRLVQERVAEAAQAVISLENTLIVAGHFGALPEQTLVFEVEPEDLEFGEPFSPAVEVAVCHLEEELGGVV